MLINTSSTEKTVFYPNGDIYEGELKENLPHGKGIFTYADGRVFKGEFEEAELHGHGEQRFPNGETYIGEFQKGKKHGNGELRDPNGSVYTGEFKNGLIHGYGKLVLGDKSVYEGEFKKGLLENPFLSEEKKNQTVLLINHESDFSFKNYVNLSKRYKNVKLLQREGIMNSDFLKSLITLPTKGTEKGKKIKFFIIEHANKKGNLVNEKFILETLYATLKEVKKYNVNCTTENKIKNIDIVLNSCYGSAIVCKNKNIQQVLKEFTKAKVRVKISTGDEKSEASDLVSNSKNTLPVINRKRTKRNMNLSSMNLNLMKKVTSIPLDLLR